MRRDSPGRGPACPVLLDVVHQNFEPAVDAAVIQVETEAPDLERFAAAFMLPGIDPRIELLEYLVVPREQRSVEYLVVPQVPLPRSQDIPHDYDALLLRRVIARQR